MNILFSWCRNSRSICSIYCFTNNSNSKPILQNSSKMLYWRLTVRIFPSQSYQPYQYGEIRNAYQCDKSLYRWQSLWCLVTKLYVGLNALSTWIPFYLRSLLLLFCAHEVLQYGICSNQLFMCCLITSALCMEIYLLCDWFPASRDMM